MQVIPNGSKKNVPTEHYERLIHIGSLLFIHSKIFLQKRRSKSYFNLPKCSGPWTETLKTVNNVTMTVNNELAVLISALHHVEGIKKTHIHTNFK